MSYPDAKQTVTGFKYEPWHWRFVGVAVATQLRASALTYNESNFDAGVSPLVALKI